MPGKLTVLIMICMCACVLNNAETFGPVCTMSLLLKQFLKIGGSVITTQIAFHAHLMLHENDAVLDRFLGGVPMVWCLMCRTVTLK